MKESNTIPKMKAFELRYQGLTYKKIAEQVDFTEETLKSYFSKKWDKEFEGYCETMNEIRDKEARRVLAGNIANASKVLVQELLSDDPKVRLRAANDIMNRKWGKPKETRELTGNVKIDQTIEEVKRIAEEGE